MRDEFDDGHRERLLHRDPRRDATDPPPPGVPRVPSDPPGQGEPDAAIELEPAIMAAHVAAPAQAPAPQPVARITNLDPRIEQLEKLVSSGNWEQIEKMLGPPENQGHLPPPLGLVYALARKEQAPADDPQSNDANDLAIRCMAGMFGISAESPLALVLAKRLLRKNPVGWQKRPAPPARISALIILVTVALGALVGWLVSYGYVTIRLPL